MPCWLPWTDWHAEGQELLLPFIMLVNGGARHYTACFRFVCFMLA